MQHSPLAHLGCLEPAHETDLRRIRAGPRSEASWLCSPQEDARRALAVRARVRLAIARPEADWPVAGAYGQSREPSVLRAARAGAQCRAAAAGRGAAVRAVALYRQR